MSHTQAKSITGAAVFLMLVAVFAAPAFGTSIAPPLNSAGSFTMLGGTISNTGDSVVTGNVGATGTITGFPPGTATGTVSSPVTAAYNDFVSAYTYASTETATQTNVGLAANETFDGNTVYSLGGASVTSTAGIELTFDAQGDSSEVFVLQTPGALTIDGPLTFNLTDGALASNIYWIVGAAATINPSGPDVIWDGNILAQTSFTMSANPSQAFSGTINGCVFAETANTLAAATDVTGCSSLASSTPEPGSAGLAALGCLLGALYMRRRRLIVSRM